MYPVRCRVIAHNPVFLGAEDAQQRLVKDVKETAIKAAAANIGIQIGLLFVPVVGQAAAAIIALVQYFTSQKYEAKTKQTIEDASHAIRAHADSADREVKAAADRVYALEYAAARALAVSGVPLDGFGSKLKGAIKKVGNVFTDAAKSLEDTLKESAEKAAGVAKQANRAVVRVVMVPGQVVTDSALKLVAEGAEAVGQKGTAERIDRFREDGKAMAKDIQSRLEDPEKAVNLITGRETYLVARDRANDLKKEYFAKIDAEKAAAISKINSDDFKLRVRVETAKALRGDPDVIMEAQLYDAQAARLRSLMATQLAQEKSAINQPTIDASAVAAPQKASSTTALVVGGGLAAVAFALFK